MNECLNCKKEITKKRKFCGMRCYSIYQRTHPSNSGKTSWFKGHIPWNKNKKMGFNPQDIAYSRILKEAEILKSQGFRVIPIGKVIPDIIAIKDNKIFAIEIEYDNPDYNKYTEEIRKFYDDIIWILKKYKYEK